MHSINSIGNTTMSNIRECFTIGHSNQELGEMVSLLKKYNIKTVIDIRREPYSSYVPQYNKNPLSSTLGKSFIEYYFLGDKLGGRSIANNEDYERIINSNYFLEGINFVFSKLQKKGPVVLLCSEKNPINCHRFFLISRYLVSQGVETKHILVNGEIVINEALEDKLLEKYIIDYNQGTIFGFQKKGQALKKAYNLYYKKLNSKIINKKGET